MVENKQGTRSDRNVLSKYLEHFRAITENKKQKREQKYRRRIGQARTPHVSGIELVAPGQDEISK